MPNFHYRAKKSNAETIVGEIAATSREDAVEKISQLGYVPVSVEERTSTGRLKRSVKVGRVRIQTLYRFSRQVVNLLKAGVPILRALDIIAGQTREAGFKKAIEQIQEGIRDGKTFSECLEGFPQIFSPLYVTMVRAGEESGRLREAVADMTEYLKREHELISRIKAALAYPIVMFTVGIATVIFVLTFVMPQISSLFSDLDQKLPAATIIVLTLSRFFVKWWWALVALGFLFVIYFQGMAKTAAGKRQLGRWQLALPYVGDLLLKVEMARFCRTMELLLQSGVSLVKAVRLAVPSVNNVLLQEQLSKSAEGLIAGRSFGETLKQALFIPEMIGQLVTVGEESGSLTETVRDIADDLEQETGETIKTMTNFLEPLMIIVVGSMIGLIVLAMLLPIFQLDVFAQ